MGLWQSTDTMSCPSRASSMTPHGLKANLIKIRAMVGRADSTGTRGSHTQPGRASEMAFQKKERPS